MAGCFVQPAIPRCRNTSSPGVCAPTRDSLFGYPAPSAENSDQDEHLSTCQAASEADKFLLGVSALCGGDHNRRWIDRGNGELYPNRVGIGRLLLHGLHPPFHGGLRLVGQRFESATCCPPDPHAARIAAYGTLFTPDDALCARKKPAPPSP